MPQPGDPHLQVLLVLDAPHRFHSEGARIEAVCQQTRCTGDQKAPATHEVAGIQLLVAVHLMMLLIWVRSGRYGTHLAGLAAVAIHVERLFVLNPTNKTD